jgi:P-type Cu+ transporter
MHREISHTDTALAPRSNLGLYALTFLLGAIIAGDLALLLVNSEATGVVFGFRLAIVAAVLGGARILYTSIDGWLDGRIGADLALAIACIASIALREHLVAAEIVFIGLVGECLESFTFNRTQGAIRKLVEFCPRRCWLLRGGQEVRVLTAELQVGDRVVVKPGARVPVDGVVAEGQSAVDVSALTGEAVPVEKGPGDEVLAGSLNQFGALTVDATRVAEHTVVGQVVEMTARALRDKAPLERTADRLARYFLPTVLGLAALTFVGAWLHFGAGWFGGYRMPFLDALEKSLVPAVSVLVVACPCALILATPAAIIAALGRLAGTGVLLKGGGALERLAGVSIFAFDKTGTLTLGRMELGEIAPLAGVGEDELLRIAAAVEQPSEHLLGQLIVREASRRGLALDGAQEFQAHPGSGVAGQVAGQRVLVGSRRLLEEQGIELGQTALALLERLDESGQTALLVAREGTVLGAIGACDQVRPEAAEIIRQLSLLGIQEQVLLTGDRAAAAGPVATAVGIAQVDAELLPQQKAELIGRLRTSGSPGRKSVAMVGDGVNDAPALASADVGIAIAGSGADIAAEAGDIVLMGDPLAPLPLLVRLSRETVRIIRQNIVVYAFGVNGLGVLLTAWLWPLVASDRWYAWGPLAGVIYHQIGSLAVLLNSMRLLWFERQVQSAPVAGARAAIQQFDGWLQRTLDFDEALHWAGHRWRAIFGWLALAIALAWAASGLTQIGPDETGILLRFGKRVALLEPGLTYSWPWPVDRVIRVQADRVRTVAIGFRGEAAERRVMAWDSPHGGNALEGENEGGAEQALMVTGDDNLLEVQATLRYRVSDPELYLLDVQNADALVRSATESVMRELVAGQRLTDLLTSRREPLEREAVARLRARLAAYRLGIVVEGLALHDLHPPPAVVQAYYEVTKAMEQRDIAENEAQARAVLDVGQAESDYLSRVAKAKVAKAREVADAQVKWGEYMAWSAARRLDFDDEWGLFLGAIKGMQSGRAPEAVCAEYLSTRKSRQELRMEMVDRRLFWDRLTRVLGSRDLLLIDAEKIGGKRTLFMFDLDALRLPMPMLAPQDELRGPPRLPFGPGKNQ